MFKVCSKFNASCLMEPPNFCCFESILTEETCRKNRSKFVVVEIQLKMIEAKKRKQKLFCRNSNFCYFLSSLSAEFIQPQNLWPYIQQNLIQQNHLTNPAFIAANNHHHSHHLHHNTNSLAVHVNGINNNNNHGSESNGLSCNNNNNNSSPEHHAVDSRDNKVIAKPLPSRPFMHHGINHPHLHSLLAHCRNPYMTGKVH